MTEIPEQTNRLRDRGLFIQVSETAVNSLSLRVEVEIGKVRIVRTKKAHMTRTQSVVLCKWQYEHHKATALFPVLSVVSFD